MLNLHLFADKVNNAPENEYEMSYRVIDLELYQRRVCVGKCRKFVLTCDGV